MQLIDTTSRHQRNYEIIQDGGVPIKTWTRGVPFEEAAKAQLKNISRLPFIHVTAT